MGKVVASDIPAAFEQMQPALYDIFSSIEVRGKEAVGVGEEILRQAAKAAVAGQVDVQTAVQTSVGLLNGYGMKKDADLINEERVTLPQIIQSENYFLTNIDIWILALYFKIPIVFISQSLLSENGKEVMVLYGEPESDSCFFVHPFTITQDVPSRFGLIEVKHEDYSLLKIPPTFTSPDLQESIRRDEEDRVSIEEYIRAFKLGNIKNKKRVFTMTEPGAAEDAALEAEPDANSLGQIAAMTQISSKASLFQ